MSIRFEWMDLPNVDYVGRGYDVAEADYVEDADFADDTTVDDSALLLSADACTVVTGSADDLAEWTVDALARVVEGADLHLYEKCAICHLFVEPNSAFTDGSDIARYVHLCNDDYPEDEALDTSHEPHPSGVRLPLAVWKIYGPAYMRARFEREQLSDDERDMAETEPGQVVTSPSNLARFTTEDAEAVIGRPLTQGEYRALVKTLENSSMGEVFAECIDAVIGSNDDEDED